MALRDLVRIDEELCDGCGECVPSCAEGAIAIVDGKARLVDEALCDGLGACLGHCPKGAITIVRADAAPFDEALAHGVSSRAVAPMPSFAAAPAHGPAAGGCPVKARFLPFPFPKQPTIPSYGTVLAVSPYGDSL